MLNLDLDFEYEIQNEIKNENNDCGCGGGGNEIDIFAEPININEPINVNVSIPKIIMQTWKTHEVPDHWKISPESIKNKMASWKYVLMSDEDNRAFVEKHFPNFLPYYDAFPYGIQRADAVRYCWLYVHGGIYIDCDFEVLEDLGLAITNTSCEIFLVKSGNIGSFYTNSVMFSRPRAKFWLEVIEEMKKPTPWYVIGKHMEVMMTSGPIMLSRVANKTDTIIGVLPAKKFMCCSICDLKCSTKGAYLKPLEGSSWVAWDTKFYNFWLCHWKKVILFIIYLLILIIIIWLLYKFNIIDKNLFK